MVELISNNLILAFTEIKYCFRNDIEQSRVSLSSGLL